MRLTIAYSKMKKRNLVLINNATYQRETLSERPIRQPLSNRLGIHFRAIQKATYTFFEQLLGLWLDLLLAKQLLDHDLLLG